MALINKQIERVIFDVEPGTSTLRGLQLGVSADVEEGAEIVAHIERIRDVWANLTGPQKTGAQNFYDRLSQLM